MRVLMTTHPAHGHFYPLVPFARALVAAGHEVLVATAASFAPVVERAGFKVTVAGLDWLESEPEAVFPEFAGTDPRARGMGLARLLFDVAPRALVPDVLRLIEEFEPDLLCGESAAAFASEIADIPYVHLRFLISSGPHPAGMSDDPEERARADKDGGLARLATLRADLGLPAFDPLREDAPASRYLTLDMNAPSLHPTISRETSRTAHPMRPVPYNSPGDPRDAEMFDGLDPSIPTVVVGLGTVFHRATEILHEILAAIGDGRYNLIMASGSLTDPASFGETHERVRIARWVPNDAAMTHADLFITHGGWGSSTAALCAGVPMLVLPQGADQPLNAVRLHSVGAARFLPAAEVTAANIASESARLLTDPVYRLNAQRLAAEIAEMPAPEECVGLVERVARDREPILGPQPFGPPPRLTDVPDPKLPSRME